MLFFTSTRENLKLLWLTVGANEENNPAASS
jgi:hypothetical protein